MPDRRKTPNYKKRPPDIMNAVQALIDKAAKNQFTEDQRRDGTAYDTATWWYDLHPKMSDEEARKSLGITDTLLVRESFGGVPVPVAWYQVRMVMSYKYDPETFTRRMKTIYDLLMSGF